MIKTNGQSHPTIADAATEFHVSTKTVQEWIKKGIISPPPEMEYGAGMIRTFPLEYMRQARRELAAYRSSRAKRSTA